MKDYYVYIMASQRNGTLYIGMTNDLVSRVWEHKNDKKEGFTKRYAIHMLVYYEIYGTAYEAIEREKQLKKWKRAWKLELIENVNPDWIDLYSSNSEILPLPKDRQ